MQDRYAGDIGDFGKIALLQALQAHGMKIGVNWYRVEPLASEMQPDGTFKAQDGKHVKIPVNLQKGHENLAEALHGIIDRNERSVEVIEELNLIPGVVYHHDYLTVENRTEWNQKALETLESATLVFLDPDNGLQVKSVGEKSARSIKYAFYKEVKKYMERGQSVLVYNHRCRKPEEVYFHDIYERLVNCVKVQQKDILAITFRRFTIRDYFAITACEEHRERILNAFLGLEKSTWGEQGFYRTH